MRISDWSSDVCSSDLSRSNSRIGRIVGSGGNSIHGDVEVENVLPDAELAVERDGGRVRGIGLDEYDVGAACRAYRSQLVDQGGRHASAAMGGGHGQEIGRASCRERVCQYV